MRTSKTEGWTARWTTRVAGPRARRAAVSIAALLLLAACGGGGSDDRDHDHDDNAVDTAGRLAVSEQGATTVRLHELDDAAAVEGSYQVDHPPSALYASPQGRYAVVAQRLQDQVQFIDAGIWQEDHGDHLHDYKQASQAVAWKLPGVRPTHYDLQAGRQAAFFMDGDAEAAPVRNAAVRLLDDGSIGQGGVLASLELEIPVHGLGEPVDDKLLAAARAADASDALPTHLDLYRRDGTGFTRVRQVAARCDGMHGSFSSGSHTVAGCRDGMLVVAHTSATEVDDGRKLATPLRVSTVAGHPRLPDHFVGIATEGTAPAPVTTRFYAVDAAAGTSAALVPQGWNTGRVRRAHAFDRTGQRFYVLDDQGALRVLQREGGGWSAAAPVAGVVPAMPAEAPWPAIVANGARDELYVTDPVARQLVVVDAATGAVQRRHDLGYVPGGIAWLGITR